MFAKDGAAEGKELYVRIHRNLEDAEKVMIITEEI
jgi:hypothetical protein